MLNLPPYVSYRMVLVILKSIPRATGKITTPVFLISPLNCGTRCFLLKRRRLASMERYTTSGMPANRYHWCIYRKQSCCGARLLIFTTNPIYWHDFGAYTASNAIWTPPYHGNIIASNKEQPRRDHRWHRDRLSCLVATPAVGGPNPPHLSAMGPQISGLSGRLSGRRWRSLGRSERPRLRGAGL